MRSNHEIDYHIYGEEMQYVEVALDPQETAIADAGAFMMMDDGIQMQTIFGDGSGQSGGEGVFFASLRRPGTVWIQTLPISRLASRVLSYGSFKRKEEGSILGGIGNMMDGDGW